LHEHKVAETFGISPRLTRKTGQFDGLDRDELCGTGIAPRRNEGSGMMSLVRLLGFRTLTCGCVTGHYREVATNREITYVEEKGTTCEHHGHRRNHTLTAARFGGGTVAARAS
jgi:hypothetical protein